MSKPKFLPRKKRPTATTARAASLTATSTFSLLDVKIGDEGAKWLGQAPLGNVGLPEALNSKYAGQPRVRAKPIAPSLPGAEARSCSPRAWEKLPPVPPLAPVFFFSQSSLFAFLTGGTKTSSLSTDPVLEWWRRCECFQEK